MTLTGRRCSVLILMAYGISLISKISAKENKTKCYAELGCFSMESPWVTLTRPFPAPLPPTTIDTMIYYYSRTSTERYNITLWPTISLNGADFRSNRPATAFITHGFTSNGNASWLSDLKDNYLKRLDANVFLIDWGKGAAMLNYLQVASNTRIVGAEVARFVNWLIKNHKLNVTTVHLMGHSLGAHTCAYIAKRIPNIGRLTGFDAAQPGFETAAKEVRLDKSDAGFVDLLHTNGQPLIPLFGFGLIYPHGDVDFYINGGASQPGCIPAFQIMKDLGKGIIQLKSIKDLAKQTVSELSSLIGCSHGRSYIYFTEALVSNCSLWGEKIHLLRRLLDAGTGGFLEPRLSSLKDCTARTCIPIGLETPRYKARGTFSVITGKKKPYCNNEGEAKDILDKLRDEALKDISVMEDLNGKIEDIQDKITDVLG